MIPLKLNKQKYSLPTIKELTVKQLKEVIKYCFDKEELNYLKYIAYFTGKTFKEIKNTPSNQIEIIKLKELIGGFIDYKKEKVPGTITLGMRTYNVEGLGLDTVGKELTYHSMLTPNISEMDAYINILAVQFMSDEDDFQSVQDNLKYIEKMNWITALSAGHFFFLHSKYSQKKGTKNIRTKVQGMLTKIKFLKRKLDLISLKIIRTRAKSRHWYA